MSWVSWLFTVEGFFEDALDEVLEAKAVLDCVNFEAAVKIGGDLEGCGGRGRWGDCGHGRLRVTVAPLLKFKLLLEKSPFRKR